MRKLILLALVALLAGTVYAETSPAFSGSFDFYNTYDLKDRGDEAENFVIGNKFDVKIAVNGVVDEWTTVNAEITKKNIEIAERIISITHGTNTYTEDNAAGATDTVGVGDKIVTDMDSYDIDNTGDDKFGDNINSLLKSGSSANVYDTDDYDFMVLGEFTMTNNLTGALGFADSPIGVSITWGKTKIDPAGLEGVAGHGYLGSDETDSYYGMKIAVTAVEKVKAVFAIFPETYYNKPGKDKALAGGIDVHFMELVEGLNFNIYYTSDPNKDTDDDTKETEETHQFGLTAGYTGLAPLKLGFATSYDIFRGVFGMGFSASYALMEDRLVPALALVIEEFPWEKKLPWETTATKQPLKLYIGLDLRFKIVPGTLDFVSNAKLPIKGETDDVKRGKDLGQYVWDEMSADAGFEAFLGSVTYGLGVEYRDRNVYSPNGDDSTGLYFRVKASF